MLEFHKQSAFKLTEAYTYGIGVANTLSFPVKCKGSGIAHDYGLLSQAVVNAGDGDYVEIGTLFGASAIVVALAKKMFSLSGDVYCIDPLHGYYRKGEAVDGVLPSVDLLMNHATQYGVADLIKPVVTKSFPFPQELEDSQFVCGFIDGDHWGKAPLEDWLNLRNRVSRYIVFDNYDTTSDHVAVLDAGKIAAADEHWSVVHMSSISLILEKHK